MISNGSVSRVISENIQSQFVQTQNALKPYCYQYTCRNQTQNSVLLTLAVKS